MRGTLWWTLLVALQFLLPDAALAQGCSLGDMRKSIDVIGYDGTLKLIKDRSCLGDKVQDRDALVQQFDELLEKSSAAQERFQHSVRALKLLSMYAAQQALAGKRGEDWQAISGAMTLSADKFAELSEGSDFEMTSDRVQRAIPLDWERIEAATEGALVFQGRRIRLLAATGCLKVALSCESFDTQRDMIRVVNLAVRLRDLTQRDGLLAHLADANVQLARWEVYRTKAVHQYFWEVWINGSQMGQDLCPIDQKTQIQIGFCATPTSQWIVMHPEVGLRWVRTATQSSELKPTLVIEVLGFNRWKWAAKSSAQMTDRLGGSLVAAYTDVGTGRKWSYGPMFHFGNGYNLSITRGSGEKWSLVVNLNLADRYFGRRQEYVDYLKALKKPSLARLVQGSE